MEKIQIAAETREVGKFRDSKNLYRQGLIPAELYGKNIGNVHLSVNQIEFEKTLRKAGESTIIEVAMPGGDVRNVLIQNVDRHYLTSKPIHADFYEVKMTEKLTANIPLEFVGESHAVKALGGTLVKVLTEVEVECLPKDLPHQIEIDISALNSFEDQITVGDIKVASGVEIKAEADEVVATVQEPRDMEAEMANNVDEAAAVAAAVGPEKNAAEGEGSGDAPGKDKSDKK